MTADGRTEFETVILGAGMSGLCMAITLAQAGRRDFVVVEKGTGLGGTWWDNRYPGAQVDVPAPLYSFSFAPNPRWTQRFAHAPEIQAYMDDLARRHGLAPHLRFGITITGAAFDEATGRWTIALDDGRRLHARFFVCSTGPLSVPRWPEIEGLASFAGERLHTARWAPAVPLAGRRVGVIGTGSTAAQLVPAIAPEVARLSVFQRTANWVMPRMDRRYGLLDHALARIPPYPAVVRWFWAGASEWLRRAFDEGTLARRRVLGEAQRQLRRQVRDEALRARLVPPYPFGCKRIIFSNDYYPALARPNVELVTDPIVRVTPAGVVTADGREHALDLLVCATGFDVQHSMAVPITGRVGAALQARWRDGAFAHLGITVAGFPNLFVLYGPNTNLGHNSIVFMLERQVAHVLSLVRRLVEGQGASVEVRAEAQARSNERIQRALAGSVWAAACHSWYKTASGKITNNWPGPTMQYWWRTAVPRRRDYRFDAIGHSGADGSPG